MLIYGGEKIGVRQLLDVFLQVQDCLSCDKKTASEDAAEKVDLEYSISCQLRYAFNLATGLLLVNTSKYIGGFTCASHLKIK